MYDYIYLICVTVWIVHTFDTYDVFKTYDICNMSQGRDSDNKCLFTFKNGLGKQFEQALAASSALEYKQVTGNASEQLRWKNRSTTMVTSSAYFSLTTTHTLNNISNASVYEEPSKVCATTSTAFLSVVNRFPVSDFSVLKERKIEVTVIISLWLPLPKTTTSIHQGNNLCKGTFPPPSFTKPLFCNDLCVCWYVYYSVVFRIDLY